MDVLYPRCCGIDVHKTFIMACLSLVGADGHRRKEIRRFGTMTGELLALVDWLQAAGCTIVAMESSSVYWKPIYNLLEGRVSGLGGQRPAYESRARAQDR